MQANVARRPFAHETALNLAYAAQVDIILIQEPSIRSEERRLARFHPGYEISSPVDDWVKDRPRVLTYLRRGTGLRGVQLRPLPNPSTDLLFLQVFSGTRKILTIINVYNAPSGSIRPGETVRDILASPCSGPDDRYLIAGNLNLRPWNWQPEATTSSPEADSLIEWIETSNLALLSPIGEPTHKDGKTLDLTWVSGSLYGASTSIERSLYTTSDHESILTLIPLTPPATAILTSGRFRLDTMDKELFLDILKRNVQPIHRIASYPRDPSSLDLVAEQLTDALMEALKASTRRTLGKDTGRPYWDKNCMQKHQAFMDKRATVARLRAMGIDCPWEQAEADMLKQDFLDQLRRSRNTYWKEKTATASTSKDVFEMVGWQKSIGAFHTPPLRDVDNPTTLVSQPKEKRDLFARVLLRNAAAAGDILAEVPAEDPELPPRAELPFPKITKDEVRVSVLRAGNTIPGPDRITAAVLKLAWPVIETWYYPSTAGVYKLVGILRALKRPR